MEHNYSKKEIEKLIEEMECHKICGSDMTDQVCESIIELLTKQLEEEGCRD